VTVEGFRLVLPDPFFVETVPIQADLESISISLGTKRDLRIAVGFRSRGQRNS